MIIKVRTLSGKEIELDLRNAIGRGSRDEGPSGEAGEAGKGNGGTDTEPEGWTENMVTVLQIKGLIEEKEGIPPDQQRLIYQGKQLQNDATVAESDILPSSTLHLVLALRGGIVT